ncbi:MAG: DUF4926 domain-containing protein [Ignavibacteriae bacterium]|nr:DUF4926 domain-containing protein [Ignavibacteriota bacterium]
MMNNGPKLLDVIAMLRDLPEQKVRRGMVGTIVETKGEFFLVEFCNSKGETVALTPLKPEDFLVLERISAQGIANL